MPKEGKEVGGASELGGLRQSLVAEHLRELSGVSLADGLHLHAPWRQ